MLKLIYDLNLSCFDLLPEENSVAELFRGDVGSSHVVFTWQQQPAANTWRGGGTSSSDQGTENKTLNLWRGKISLCKCV